VEAPGLDGEGDGTAGEGEDMAGFAPVPESGADEFRGIEDGARGAAGDEGAIVEVGAVEETLGEEGNAATPAGGFHGPTGKADGGDAGEAVCEGLLGGDVFRSLIQPGREVGGGKGEKGCGEKEAPGFGHAGAAYLSIRRGAKRNAGRRVVL